MKYKKYLFFLVFIMFWSVNIVDAVAIRDTDALNYYSNQDTSLTASCYYESNDLKASVYFHFTKVNLSSKYTLTGDVTVFNYGTSNGINMTGKVMNLDTNYRAFLEAVEFPKLLIDVKQLKNNYFNCPKYLVFGEYLFGKNEAFVTNDSQTASIGASDSTHGGYYAQNVSKEQFLGDMGCKGNCLGTDVVITCDNNELFGDPNDSGEYTEDGTEIRPASVAYLIKQALNVVSILVVVLLIVLGTIDFGKAVIASKEDEIKKAQGAFIKRIIVGVLIFLVPTIVTGLMKITDDIWNEKEYKSCTIEQIVK